MTQDIVANALNMMMNAKRSRKKSLDLKDYSKLLISILAIAKLNGYVKDYKVSEKSLKIELGILHGCQAIKPRLVVHSEKIDKFLGRYLPARNIGILILSTSKGLMTHQTAIDKKIGGSLVAYMY